SLFSSLSRAHLYLPFPYTTLFRSLLLALPAGFVLQRINDFQVHVPPQLLPFDGAVVQAWREIAGAHSLIELFLGQHHFFAVIERSEEHTSELQSLAYLVCRLLLEK